jgi:hypothetical protein
MPIARHALRNVSDRYTPPWSHTIVPGTTTGRAAASASRSSISARRRWGSTDRDMRSASAQPGRIGSGVRHRARSKAASAPFADGRSTAAGIVLVAQSIIQVSSGRPVIPLSKRAAMFSGEESINIHWPGRNAVTVPGSRSVAGACDRRVRADPRVWPPGATPSSSR